MDTNEFTTMLGKFVENFPGVLKAGIDRSGLDPVQIMCEFTLPRKVVELLEDYQKEKGMREYNHLIEEALLKTLIGGCARHPLTITPSVLSLLLVKDA